MIKTLCIKRDTIPLLDKTDGSLALSDLEKQTYSVTTLKKFSPHTREELNQSSYHDKYIQHFLFSPIPVSLPAKPTSLIEIVEILKKTAS